MTIFRKHSLPHSHVTQIEVCTSLAWGRGTELEKIKVVSSYTFQCAQKDSCHLNVCPYHILILIICQQNYTYA